MPSCFEIAVVVLLLAVIVLGILNRPKDAPPLYDANDVVIYPVLYRNIRVVFEKVTVPEGEDDNLVRLVVRSGKRVYPYPLNASPAGLKGRDRIDALLFGIPEDRSSQVSFVQTETDDPDVLVVVYHSEPVSVRVMANHIVSDAGLMETVIETVAPKGDPAPEVPPPPAEGTRTPQEAVPAMA